MYADDDFVGLQAAFALFRALLSYHLPKLHVMLEQHEAPPGAAELGLPFPAQRHKACGRSAAAAGVSAIS